MFQSESNTHSSSLTTPTHSRRSFLRASLGAGLAISLANLIAACEDDDDDGAGETAGASEEASDDQSVADDDGEEDPDEDDSTTASDETDDGSEETPTSDRPALTIGVQGLPPTSDPAQHISIVGNRVHYSLFDCLLETRFRDSDPPGAGFEVGPMLAESWERIDDNTMEFALRDDVLFHDGTPMTAEDVKFSFERVLVDTPAELVNASGILGTISEVEIVDDYTVRLITHEPDPILDSRVAAVASWILPKAYHEEVGLEEFALNPIGTGPYRFVEMSQDEQLVLEAFDDYWGGVPPASHVTFRVLPETSGRIAALVSGEIDIISDVPPDQISALESADGVNVLRVPQANAHVLVYNPTHPVLEDNRLRQALSLGIDRQLLIDSLWTGEAILTRGTQFEWYGDLYDEERPYTEYDPERAAQLVEESGYAGETITFHSHPTYYTLGADAAQAIIEMWAEIGINAEVILTESMGTVEDDESMVRNWSLGVFPADPDGTYWRGWGPSGPWQQRWWDPPARHNELGEQARQTLDTDFRFEAYREILDIFEQEAPGTILYLPIKTYGARDNIDWVPYAFWYMDFRASNLSFQS